MLVHNKFSCIKTDIVFLLCHFPTSVCLECGRNHPLQMLSVHSMDFITSNNIHWMITSEGKGKTYMLKRNCVGVF